MSMFGNVIIVVFQSVFYSEIYQNNIILFFKNYFWHQRIVLKSGPAGRSGARTGPGWKKRGRKNPVWPGNSARPDCKPVDFCCFFTTTILFWLKKNWPSRPGDPVKTWNLDLGLGRILKLYINVSKWSKNTKKNINLKK